MSSFRTINLLPLANLIPNDLLCASIARWLPWQCPSTSARSFACRDGTPQSQSWVVQQQEHYPPPTPQYAPPPPLPAPRSMNSSSSAIAKFTTVSVSAAASSYSIIIMRVCAARILSASISHWPESSPEATESPLLFVNEQSGWCLRGDGEQSISTSNSGHLLPERGAYLQWNQTTQGVCSSYHLSSYYLVSATSYRLSAFTFPTSEGEGGWH